MLMRANDTLGTTIIISGLATFVILAVVSCLAWFAAMCIEESRKDWRKWKRGDGLGRLVAAIGGVVGAGLSIWLAIGFVVFMWERF